MGTERTSRPLELVFIGGPADGTRHHHHSPPPQRWEVAVLRPMRPMSAMVYDDTLYMPTPDRVSIREFYRLTEFADANGRITVAWVHEAEQFPLARVIAGYSPEGRTNSRADEREEEESDE